jgi:hypothetical protein
LNGGFWIDNSNTRPPQSNKVLDDFVATKLILESEAGDGRVHYRINRRKQKQIRALLEGRDA